MEMTRASHNPRYVVERVLGRGGMSTVYLARDSATGRPVALKTLADHLVDDSDHGARFVREAKVAAGLEHPNIVRVLEVDEDDGSLTLVLEYIEGGTLARALARERRLSPERTVEIGTDICAALEYAHGAGLVHRDVTPHNILLAGDGAVKLTDFGIARPVRGATLTEHGTVLGTAAYLAPEQGRGEPVTASADIYSLGAVLYECLAGRPPYRADSLPALLLERERSAAPPLRAVAPDVPHALAALVDRCLERAPGRRPRSAAELGDALRETVSRDESRTLVPGATTCVLRSAAPTAVRRSPRRRRSAAAIVALTTVITGGVAAALGVSRDGPGRPAGAASHTAPASTHVEQPPMPRPAAALVPLVTIPLQTRPCEGEQRGPSDRGHGHGKGRGKAKGHDKRQGGGEQDGDGRPC